MTEQKKLNYMHQVDAWLTMILVKVEGETPQGWLDRVKTQIKDKLLESYRNGRAVALRELQKNCWRAQVQVIFSSTNLIISPLGEHRPDDAPRPGMPGLIARIMQEI